MTPDAADVRTLPTFLTSLVGREAEVGAAAALLRQPRTRLLTLTGPGGVGKTRLAVRVAAVVAPAFSQGALFVPLAGITDPALVVDAIARTLGVDETAEPGVWEAVLAASADAALLLVLDNVEQVLAVAPRVADLLGACPGLTVLATSRAPLSIRAEQLFPVPPLALPDPTKPALDHGAVATDAVRLFVERAQAVEPALVLDGREIAAVTEICWRLDGLPLAIELAAARTRLLRPREMVARLEPRLPLLVGGPRDAPGRLRTMRDAIVWSYDLLSPEERTLFRRLAVFAGGFDLEAAAAVGRLLGAESTADPDPLTSALSVLELLDSLVRQCLLQPRQGSDEVGARTRFAMLETVREFAGDVQAAAGEEDAARRSHAAHYLAFLERAQAGLRGPTEGAWLDRLATEHDNFRAAFDWALAHEPRTALRLGHLLTRFWAFRGHIREGYGRLERALARDDGAPTTDRARALYESGSLAEELGLFDQAEARYQAALAIWRAAGDREWTAKALDYLGFLAQLRGDIGRALVLHESAMAEARATGDAGLIAAVGSNCAETLIARGDLDAAAPLLEEALRQWRARDDPYKISVALSGLGAIAFRQGEFGRAIAFQEENLRLKRELGNAPGIADAMGALGEAVLEAGDVARGEALIVEAIARHREVGDERSAARAHLALSWAAACQGDENRAGEVLAEALRDLWRLGDRASVADAVAAVAGRSVRLGRHEAALRVGGAAEGLRQTTGAVPDVAASVAQAADLARARRGLGEIQAAEVWEAGRRLSMAAAVAAAVSEAAEPVGPEPAGRTADDRPLSPRGPALTRREGEVLRLVAAGKSDREIAAVLSISPRTAEYHVSNLLAKLGVESRAAAAAHGVRCGLA